MEKVKSNRSSGRQIKSGGDAVCGGFLQPGDA